MPVSIPTAGPWKIDWSQVTKDNFGNTLDFSMTTLDKVEVGFFQGKQPAEIQADFLNIEQDATSLYTYSVPAGQKYVDLMSTPTSGGTFPGFTEHERHLCGRRPLQRAAGPGAGGVLHPPAPVEGP